MEAQSLVLMARRNFDSLCNVAELPGSPPPSFVLIPVPEAEKME